MVSVHIKAILWAESSAISKNWLAPERAVSSLPERLFNMSKHHSTQKIKIYTILLLKGVCSLAARCSKANNQVRLVQGKVWFILDADSWWWEWVNICPKNKYIK